MVGEFLSSQCAGCDGRGWKKVVSPKWLREVRGIDGRSLRAMAKRCGVSAAYLSDIERGKRGVPEHIHRAYRLMKAMHEKKS